MSFWTSTLVEAGRKEHRCASCFRSIAKGEPSRHERGLFEGDFQDHRLCLPCHDFIERCFKLGELERGEGFEYGWLPDIARDLGVPWPPNARPHRVQLSRRKGWRMPPNTVKVDRTTRWGNDFIMAHEGTRAVAVAHFRNQAEGNVAAFPDFYEPLRGKNLACWCGLDVECHGDVLLELANR